MAVTSPKATMSGHFLSFLGLFTLAVRAGPESASEPGSAADMDLRCPEYVARHAPLVWLHSDDPFKPSDLLTHIRHTTPALDGLPIRNLPPLDLDNLEVLNEYGDLRVALTSDDDPDTRPPWMSGATPDADGRVHNATPCVVILNEKNDREVDAFYFYFYSYNEGPNITQVLAPLDRLVDGEKAASGIHFGNHVGDWEHNMVRFRDGRPVGIYYSQHVDGAAYDWDDSRLSKTDGRPVVYSARGSHANYPAPGNQIHNAAIVDYCDAGHKWDPVLSAYFYRLDAETFTVTRLEPPAASSPTPPPSSNLTSFFYYAGRWGDASYPDSDPRQDTIARFGIKRYESGPTGPKYKQLVRRGLRPDKRRKIGWTEWAVGVYMSLYPCCLKGWRAWVSLGAVAVVLSAAIIGIVVAVRRYRTRKYRKLQAEDTPLDDWVLEEEALLSSSEDDDDDDDEGLKTRV